MEQNFNSNIQPSSPQTLKKIPAWSIILIAVIAVIFVAGLAIYFLKNNKTTVTQTQSQKENINISGDYGPYNFDDASQEVSVSVGDHNWGVVFQNLGRYHVVVKNQEVGIFDSTIFDFKVTDNFYGFRYVKNGKWYVRINNNDYGPFDDNVKLLISNNNWATQYFDNQSQHDKAIVNGKAYNDFIKQIYVSDNFAGVVYGVKTNNNLDSNSFVVLNDKTYGPYPSSWISLSANKDNWLINYTIEPHSSVVIVNDKQYALDLGDSYLESCDINSSDLWACEYPGKDNSWHVVMYENGNKKEYGSYGKFTDPREPAYLVTMKNGFMLNLGNQLIINDNGAERKIIKPDISYVQTGDNYMGYFYTQAKNYYVNIDGKDYGPYEYISNFSVTDNGWGFDYLNNRKTMAYINGTILESVGDSSVSKNNWGVGYEKDGKLYVKIGNN